MYRDLKNSPFYKNSQGTPESSSPWKAGFDSLDPFYGGNKSEIDPEIRYGFEPRTTKNYVSESPEYEFQSSEDRKWEYKSKLKPIQQTTSLKFYDDEHFFKHEEECEVCDYIEVLQNMDAEHFKEMFVFSEVIGKPKALRRK